jgi:hypothetical protein
MDPNELTPGVRIVLTNGAVGVIDGLIHDPPGATDAASLRVRVRLQDAQTVQVRPDDVAEVHGEPRE